MDESTSFSNPFVDDIVVHTKNRDDVPTPATCTTMIEESENEPTIEVDVDIPVE